MTTISSTSTRRSRHQTVRSEASSHASPAPAPAPASRRHGRVGVRPYEVRPIKNFESFILFANISLPRRGVPSRAWLCEPEGVGSRAVVRLETTPMNLGMAGDAPRVQVESPHAARGSQIERITACMLRPEETVAGSFVFGTTENSRGMLTASAAPVLVDGAVSVSAFQFRTPRTAAAVDTGVPCVVTSPDGRELCAIPVSRDIRRQIRRNPQQDINYGSEFYLVWREVAAPDGFSVTFTFVPDSSCGCPLVTVPRGLTDVVAGPEWAF